MVTTDDGMCHEDEQNPTNGAVEGMLDAVEILTNKDLTKTVAKKTVHAYAAQMIGNVTKGAVAAAATVAVAGTGVMQPPSISQEQMRRPDEEHTASQSHHATTVQEGEMFISVASSNAQDFAVVKDGAKRYFHMVQPSDTESRIQQDGA